MFIGQVLPFVKSFVDEVDVVVRAIDPAAGLSRIQKEWLGFCLPLLSPTQSVWTRFERACLGERSARSLSWLFCQANHWWSYLFQTSIRVILTAEETIREAVSTIKSGEYDVLQGPFALGELCSLIQTFRRGQAIAREEDVMVEN